MSAAVRHLRSALLGAAAALAACARLSGDAGPRPLSVTPTGAYRGQAARVRITGTGYQVRGVQHLGGSGEVSTAFEVRIGGRMLADAVYIGAENGQDVLEATVPADLGAGVHDLEVRDPYGLSGVLPQAFTESDRAPPSLSASVTAPAAAEAGVAFPVAIEIANQGEEAAQLDTVSVAGTALGSAAGQILPGRGTLMLQTAALSAQPGSYDLDVRVAATDTVTGLALPQVAQLVPVQVLVPPALVLRPLAPPAAVDVGQSFALDLEVANGGEIDALAVQPVLASGGALSGPLPAPQDVPAASVRTFHFLVQGGAPGTVIAQGSAAGMDAITGGVVQAPPVAFAPVAVQLPAALSVSAFTLPPAISRGQTFTVGATITNSGGATASGVQPRLLQVVAGGGAGASVTAMPAPADIPGGTSASFVWRLTENGTASGTLAFSVDAVGTDANSGAALSAAPVTSASVPVQTPATLAATLSAPTTVPLGNQFTLSLQVTNTGDATAGAVAPSTPAATGTGAVSVVSGPTPATATVPGHASATFSWTVGTLASGTVQLDTNVSGTDGNDGGLRSASASATLSVAPVPESTQLSADPFSGDGTIFSYLFSYQGMVYLGPNKSGTAAVRMAPDGTNPQTIPWQLEVDQATPARNGAYVTSPGNPTPPPCRTIGSAVCKKDTTACGPDNEFGLGVLISGFASGVEWYALSGPSPTGGSRYIYMTNGTFPLAAGGYDDLAFVQIAAGQTGAARMISAAAFANDRLYLGFFDEGGIFTPPTAPVLNEVVTMPGLPGYVAAAGADLINLQAVNLPAVGASGTPANSGKIWLMIDSIASLGTSLYVANDGGIARSVGAPTPCASSGCANWANATPSAAAWTAKTSVAVGKAALGALEPAQKAVPGMVAFGGHLFAARNTTTGPQLWSCNPALGADPAQCEPGDWSLVAPNSSGDTQLTQFDDVSNGAIALLVATAQHLYLGFNDAAGVQIFRTATPSAAARSDFIGQAGCNAATTGCHGLGGDGLGAGATRLFDGHAFTYSQLEWVYLTAGDGSTAPRVFRLAP